MGGCAFKELFSSVLFCADLVLFVKIHFYGMFEMSRTRFVLALNLFHCSKVLCLFFVFVF